MLTIPSFLIGFLLIVNENHFINLNWTDKNQTYIYTDNEHTYNNSIIIVVKKCLKENLGI